MQSNINFLNGLLFLITVGEVLERLYRTKEGKIFAYQDPDAKESDAFPVAIAQARSLNSLLNGKITFIEFLGESKRDNYDHEQHRAYYGAVTGMGTIDNLPIMIEKLCAINEKYNAKLASMDAWTELKQAAAHTNPNGYLLGGRSRMYLDLKNCYGSGSESNSDSQDYSSPEEGLDVTMVQHKAR